MFSKNGPILFVQKRIGVKESLFNLVKFRTLKNEETLPLESRKFALGTWLRKTSLDELPQLINVIKGDMSLVGPRPLPVEYAELFTPEQRERFKVKPGITGLAQVNGGTQLAWSKKFNYDLQYIKNQSFWGDITILLKTLLVVFNKKDDGLLEKPFTRVNEE
jgi:lipopolysaccharide/colanic/teichoic acid biosynthesis glycosyltransferase